MSLQTYSAAQILSHDSKDLIEEIVLLVSHAFTEDPGNKWLFSNHTREQYIQQLPHFMRFMLTAALNAGATITVIRDSGPITSKPSDKVSATTQGLQIQLPPNATIRSLGVLISPESYARFESIMNAIHSGLLMLPWYCGFGLLYKLFFTQVPAMMAMQNRMWSGPDAHKRHELWHLIVLATHPEAQGQGLGKKILLEFQRVAREAGPSGKGMSLYLEASSPDSKRLYERVGFVQRGESKYGTCRQDQAINVGSGGAVLGGTFYGMVWDP